MQRLITLLVALLTFSLMADGQATQTWVEGTNYTRLAATQHTSVPPGKVEVMEVFSYGCIVCNNFQPTMERLRKALPASAQIVLLPASFNPSEGWPMYQRAFFAARALGIVERTHQAIFDAIWKTGGACEH